MVSHSFEFFAANYQHYMYGTTHVKNCVIKTQQQSITAIPTPYHAMLLRSKTSRMDREIHGCRVISQGGIVRSVRRKIDEESYMVLGYF